MLDAKVEAAAVLLVGQKLVQKEQKPVEEGGSRAGRLESKLTAERAESYRLREQLARQELATVQHALAEQQQATAQVLQRPHANLVFCVGFWFGFRFRVSGFLRQVLSRRQSLLQLLTLRS